MKDAYVVSESLIPVSVDEETGRPRDPMSGELMVEVDRDEQYVIWATPSTIAMDKALNEAIGRAAAAL